SGSGRPITITGQSGTRQRCSSSALPSTSTSGLSARGRSCALGNASTSKPSLRSWRSRKPRIDASGSARSNAVMGRRYACVPGAARCPFTRMCDELPTWGIVRLRGHGLVDPAHVDDVLRPDEVVAARRLEPDRSVERHRMAVLLERVEHVVGTLVRVGENELRAVAQTDFDRHEPSLLVRTPHRRPERTTPTSSHTPSSVESTKQITEMTFTPSTCGPPFAKTPIRLDPIRPPVTTSAITSR